MQKNMGNGSLASQTRSIANDSKKIVVKSVSVVTKCEVCHKGDMFNVASRYCSRCERYISSDDQIVVKTPLRIEADDTLGLRKKLEEMEKQEQLALYNLDNLAINTLSFLHTNSEFIFCRNFSNEALSIYIQESSPDQIRIMLNMIYKAERYDLEHARFILASSLLEKKTEEIKQIFKDKGALIILAMSISVLLIGMLFRNFGIMCSAVAVSFVLAATLRKLYRYVEIVLTGDISGGVDRCIGSDQNLAVLPFTQNFTACGLGDPTLLKSFPADEFKEKLLAQLKRPNAWR